MRTILILVFIGSAGILRANDTLWLSLWRKAPVVVQAKIIECGRSVRMEEVIHCNITCVVTRYYKGHVAEGDTIQIDVTVHGETNLGGKMQADPVKYEVGKEYVFFLEMIYHNRFRKGSLYRPVDDWHGALVPTMALQIWLVNDAGDAR